MNTSQIKALFFAQYFNQSVYMRKDWEDFNDSRPNPVGAMLLTETNKYFVEVGYLLLRTVSQLTDEELINLITIQSLYDDIVIIELCKFGNVPYIKYHFSKGNKEVYSELALFDGGTYSRATNAQFQYMLRVGILLPFTFINEQGKPETYSPEKLIELGWCKIK